MVISAIAVKCSTSLSQAGFSSLVSLRFAQWHYVPTAYNPVDDSSRGIDAIKSSELQRQFKGPNFLSQPEDQWPKQISAEVSEGDPEVKPAAAVNVITIKQDLLSQLEGRISSWEKMGKNYSPYFEPEYSIIKSQTKEGITDKQFGIHWYTISRCKIATRSQQQHYQIGSSKTL